VEITQVEAIVFDLNTGLAFVPPRATLELKDENGAIGENHCVNSLTSPGDWVFQKHIPTLRNLLVKRRPKNQDLLSPRRQLFRRQLGEPVSGYAGLATDYQVFIMLQERGHWGRIVRRHKHLI
jgi:hypothetical protein